MSTHNGLVPPPPSQFYSTAQLNEDCAVLVQNAASFFSGRKQIGGSFQEALIMSQAIFQALNIQEAIERARIKANNPS